MRKPVIHIIGAGLAGLAAAVRLREGGADIAVHEATSQAGGRCRSYHDATLGMTIDNGNHVILSGNHAALGYLQTIGGRDRLTAPERAVFPFVDLDIEGEVVAPPERWPPALVGVQGRPPGARHARHRLFRLRRR